jgi:hypothetical protein
MTLNLPSTKSMYSTATGLGTQKSTYRTFISLIRTVIYKGYLLQP